MTSSRFDPGSTSVRPQKPWTSSFYGSMNGPGLKTLIIFTKDQLVDLMTNWNSLPGCFFLHDKLKFYSANPLNLKGAFFFFFGTYLPGTFEMIYSLYVSSLILYSTLYKNNTYNTSIDCVSDNSFKLIVCFQ